MPMRHFVARLLPLVLSLAAACGTATQGGLPPADRVIDRNEDGFLVRQGTGDERAQLNLQASFDRAWVALGQAYALLGVPATTADKPSGQFGNGGFVMPREFNGKRAGAYFRCGNDLAGPLVERGRLVVLMMTQLVPATPTETRGVTNVSAKLTRFEGTSGAPIVCSSTGALEEELRTKTEQLLAKAG
jgi:hypothetical protein